MNYIAQLNGFFDLKQLNPLSSNAQTLYINLFYIDNRCGWKPRFTVSNVTLQSMTGLSRQQLDRARNELVQKGYVEYKKGSGNQCGTYLLVCFDTQNDTQVDTQTDTQADTQTGHKMCTLNKLKQKQKTKKDTPIPPKGERVNYMSVVDLFNNTCTSLPHVRYLTDQRKKSIKARINDGNTADDFREVFEKVQSSDFLTGKQGGWRCGFDWILKPSNWQKIREGNYDNEARKASNQALSYAQRNDHGQWDDIVQY